MRLFKSSAQTSENSLSDSMHTIPENFLESERIVRVLYFPKYVKKDEKSIKSNAFRTPADIDEVSVIRLEYSNSDFCKQHGKKHENPAEERAYFGLSVIKVDEIRKCGADIKYTPDIPYNPAHSDITIGHIPKKGVQLPSEFQFIVDELAKKARLYKDPDVTTDSWGGAELL